MPPAPIQMGAVQQPWYQKMAMGGLMGVTVGCAMGVIFGGFTVLRGGAGAQGPLKTIATYMGTSAATFGFFMSIGSVVRNDSPFPIAGSAVLTHPQLVRMRIASRAEGRAHFAGRA